LIKPSPLKKGDTIGIVSPSFWMDEITLEKVHQLFRIKGYQLEFGDSNYLKSGPFAGTPQERANDINRMFANPDIDAIICARGGYGANRVLPHLDYDLIKVNPKIFMGYSDITALLTSITQQTELVTFHGPMLTTYKNGIVDYNFELMEKTLSGQNSIIIQPPRNLSSHILIPGETEGPLWGGNMCLLANRLGTNEPLNTNGVILFLEDIDEYLYSFDRMLVHMRKAGMFDNIKGLILGELVNMKDQKIPFGKSTDEIVIDVCGNLDMPIITNFPCGHGKYQATMPISTSVRLDATSSSPILTILESTVT